jgi:MipA family protein
MRLSRMARLICLLAPCLAPVLARAQEFDLFGYKGLGPETFTSDVTPEQFAKLMSTTNRIGPGALIEPTYPGGNGLRTLALPDIDWSYNNRLFVNMEDGAGVYLYNDGRLSMGPSTFIRLGRDQTNNPNLLGLGDISATPQARFLTEYDLGWLDIKGAVAHDFSGSYGTTFGAKVGTVLPITNQLLVLPGLTTSLGDHRYMQAWYGVSESQSLLTGKPVYRARSGVESVGTQMDTLFRFAPNLALVARGAVSYIVSNVARSPVVERRFQPMLGLGISYLFK